MRVTLACPANLIADANQLMRCIGMGPGDDCTFGTAEWRDGAGAPYAVASGIFDLDFSGLAGVELVAPVWGCDLAAARRAQGLLSPGAVAGPGRIAAALADDPAMALTALGVAALAGDGG